MDQLRRVNFSFQAIFLCSLFYLLSTGKIYATHIRAGEIVAVRTSNASLTYKFTVIGYTDTGSSVIFGGGDIDFGDGTVLDLVERADNSGTSQLEGEVAYNFFEITHTFTTPGKYSIHYSERNRSAGVQNMSGSVDTPFYTETTILIDPLVGENTTPVFLVPPIDKGVVGVAFLHNPGAFDSDGDSLSYRITAPKQVFDREVNNYLSPADPEFYENYLQGNEDLSDIPVFEIDEITGNVLWDAPGTPGEYNIAFIVDEWRKIEGQWFLLGSLTRDMQIIIEDSDNKRPNLTPPANFCLGAGSSINAFITATDPDAHQVKIEAFGGPFELEDNAAVIGPDGFQDTPASATFIWEPTCENIIADPYVVIIKATDSPDLGPKLVDFNFFTIQLTAPIPKGLKIDDLTTNDKIPMSWDLYENCEMSQIEIWRKVGAREFEVNSCEALALDKYGYDQIGFEETGTSTFADDQLASGAKYCYRIQATKTDKLGGKSLPSNEACFTAPAIAAVPVKVDVSSTGETDGVVELAWLSPFDLTEDMGPYTYHIFRGFSLNQLESVSTTSSLQFTDTGVNSSVKLYYRIDTYDSESNLVSQSVVSSTVSLITKTNGLSVQLNWSVESPWSVMDSEHSIYRDQVEASDPSKFVKIGSINPNESGMRYADTDVLPDIDYHYYVEVAGDYHNEAITGSISNKSQIAVGRAVINGNNTVEAEQISVFPNPFQRLIHIKNMGIPEDFSLINARGQVIMSSTHAPVLDGSSLKSGVYYLQFSSGKVVRLIKK